ncbi:MAG: dephospho-CoA kinase [Pseudomonadota bacterium]
MPFIVGLTGGIGSGKSTVAELFASRGARLVDSDVIAHQLSSAPGPAMTAIAAAFGTEFVRADGGLERAAMRRLVFADPARKQQLEAILHPMIRQEAMARCAAQSAAPYVLLIVPLLVESGSAYRKMLDRILLVDCAEALQRARVAARNAWPSATIDAVINSQASRAQRLAIADDVLCNNTTSADLHQPISELHALYLALAATKAS